MLEDYSDDQRTAFCRAMANIIASDHKVTPEERAELDGLVLSTGLSPDDTAVKAAIEAELANPGELGAILATLGDKKLHAALYRMMIEAACADGEVASEERAKLAEASAAFGFDRGAAEELIGWTLDSIRLERREKEILGKLR